MSDDYIRLNLKDENVKRKMKEIGVSGSLIDDSFEKYEDLVRRKKNYKELDLCEINEALLSVGLSKPHIDWLISRDSKKKKITEWDEGSGYPVYIKMGNMIEKGEERGYVSVLFDLKFDGLSLSEVIHYERLGDFKYAGRNSLTNKLEIVEIKKMIYPFSASSFLNFRIGDVVDLILDGELEPFFYPWANRTIFDDSCRPLKITDRRLDYSELSDKCKEMAIIHLNDYKKFFPSEGAIWQGYLGKYYRDKTSFSRLREKGSVNDRRLSRALYIWNNWDFYENRRNNEKRTPNKVFEYVGEEEGVTGRAIYNAINKEFCSLIGK